MNNISRSLKTDLSLEKMDKYKFFFENSQNIIIEYILKTFHDKNMR